MKKKREKWKPSMDIWEMTSCFFGRGGFLHIGGPVN